MILTSHTFLSRVQIQPAPDKWQIQATALDLRIGTELYFPSTKLTLDVAGNIIFIDPGEHFLIKTLEKVTLPNDVVGVVYPRSSTNRRGITVDITGIVDAGYSGHLMIPVTNNTLEVIPLYVGERIASIIFQQVEALVEIRESKYHNGTMEAKPDKEEELAKLKDGSLLYEKKK